MGPVLFLRISLSVVSAVMMLMGAASWRLSGRVTGARTISLLMVAAGLYTFGYAQEMAQTTFSAAFFWLHFEYLGIPWLPALWLFLARRHMGLRTPKWLILIIPCITLAAQWSNDYHHLYDTSMRLVANGPFWVMDAKRGPLAWLHLGNMYFSVLYGTMLYARAFRSASRLFRIQMLVFIGGSLPPLLGNFLYMLGVSPWGLDLGPVAMILSASLAYIAVYDLECFDLVPMARSQVFRSMRDAVLVTDLHYRVVDFNPAAEQLIRTGKEKVLGCPIGNLLGQDITPEEIFIPDAYPQPIELERGGEPHSFEATVLTLGEPGHQTGWALILADITDQMRLLQELQRHAQTDALTGVANRRHFFVIVEREYARMTRHPDPFTLVLIDLDNFKSINDRNGHAVGDQVLRMVTRTIESCLRATDTLGRFGGDEFAILLPQTDLDSACEVAERIRAAVDQKVAATEKGDFQVTLSLGVAAYDPMHPEPWSNVLEEADRALYRAKAEGRNCVNRQDVEEVGTN